MILQKFRKCQLSTNKIFEFLIFSFYLKYYRTWLTSNVDAARAVAKRHQHLLDEISDKVNGIKERFKLKSIEYNNEWSVPQFYTCLRTLLMYADKWHERLLTLQGILKI
jgi:hypothetical protein